ncbi:MAG: hypothetical protein JSU72_07290 [Deltaproteobacteria bacterium]|nr:MAG: hypothetical protein JSU72_07290 [Deltaproteobacteria bacterium]
MRKLFSPLFVFAVITAMALPLTHMGSMSEAWACNWGSPGGGDFSPLARYYRDTPRDSDNSITRNQAYDIVSGLVARLNPNLEVGESVDAGTHYEFEILIEGKGVDRLAVDKATGLIRPAN